MIKMTKRPKSITVISWMLIIMTVLTVISISITLIDSELQIQTDELMELSPLLLKVHYFVIFLGIIVTLISAIAILKGKNWGRLIFFRLEYLKSHICTYCISR